MEKLWIWEIIKTTLNAQQNKAKQTAKAFNTPCLKQKAKNQRTFVIRLVLIVTDQLKLEKPFDADCFSACKWGK